LKISNFLYGKFFDQSVVSVAAVFLLVGMAVAVLTLLLLVLMLSPLFLMAIMFDKYKKYMKKRTE
jgi:type IV secretory pathway VirB6-like protein